MENKTCIYKKIYHFKEWLMSIENNKLNSTPTYTDKQFKEDLQKWINKTNIEFGEVTIARDLKG